MTTRPNSLGVLYIHTPHDDPAEMTRVYKEIQQTIQQDFLFIPIDGSQFPDITVCLNLGIKAALDQGIEYVHWAHGDMYYLQDPTWYDVLRSTLQAYPEVMKICASNSRDEIHPPRIGQEQTWLMRTADFKQNPWLWFDERFIRCGGCEDYAQHLNILARGKLVCITPETTVMHRGMQTRSRYDSNPHQLANQHAFGQFSHLGQLVEVHQPTYFGWFLNSTEYDFAVAQLSGPWKELHGERCALPCPVGVLQHDLYPQYGEAIRALYEEARRTSDFE